MFLYYFLSFVLFFNNLFLFNCQSNNNPIQSINQQNNIQKNDSIQQNPENEKELKSNVFLNPLAFYRIDSIYNGYSITLNKEVNIKLKKQGDSQNFQFIEFENAYFIESRLSNRRIGVNENNEVIDYRKNDEKNNDKMLWYVKLFEINNETNNTEILLQNKFNLKYLELNEINETYSILICNMTNLENDKYYKTVFSIIKIFELSNIKPEHINYIENEPIDIVIKYIDLTDKELIREGITQVKKDQDNQELKYSVRSIFQYVPWVRKIFIIMPNQKVKYFRPYNEIKDKFVYVKDKDLIGFDSANSAIFQLNLFRLKSFGLSDNFIYMDDDYFFGDSLKKWDFFYFDEKIQKVVPHIITSDFKEMDYNETINKYNKLFSLREKLNPHAFFGWKLSMLASEKLLLENFNIKPMLTTYFTHVAIPLNIHDIEECYDLILRRYKYIEETLYSLDRHILILQSEHLFTLYALNVKKRKVHYVSYNYLIIKIIKEEYLHTPLYVVNRDGDTKYVEEDYKRAKDILEKRYPKRTKYELPYDLPDEELEEKKIKKNENITEEKNENEEEIKNDTKIDFNLTKNEFYMDSIFVQKKKELEIKYKNKINEYKKSIWKLFYYFIVLLILLIIIYLFSKLEIKISITKYDKLELNEEVGVKTNN